jgi:hypothetical protein
MIKLVFNLLVDFLESPVLAEVRVPSTVVFLPVCPPKRVIFLVSVSETSSSRVTVCWKFGF